MINYKIATWNVNHRAARKTIPSSIAQSIISTNPDIIVFTEFVHCDTQADRQQFYDQLRNAGYTHQLLSVTPPKENHVLIASRQEIIPGDIAPPSTIHPSVPSNFLHIKTTFENRLLEIIGIRVPDYSKSIYKEVAQKYWEWFSDLTEEIVDRSVIMIGDFNIDPSMKKYKFRHHLNDLLENGWQIASPADGASFYANHNNAPHRLDHAFLTQNLTIMDAAYIQEVKGLWKCGENKYREPDHAMLVIDVVVHDIMRKNY
ncbi:MAG: endonuclease/exonuclease/phosphatase family protein [Proteobacteria bacterium]|nr:endonuclease/exonuclease/phosphatase family protein [Pseudomonadota bacterium]